MGFPVPIGQWLKGAFAPIVDEFVLGARANARGHFDRSRLQQIVAEHRLGRSGQGDALWLLVNLEIWQRIFCDGEQPSQVMRSVRFAPSLSNKRSSVRKVQCAFSG
jgi:asparagine synthase (glutamine-hydrolysing)